MPLLDNATNLRYNGKTATKAYFNGIEVWTPVTASGEVNLVLSLDAADYIGSGDWLDTSGNNNNGTLVQTPTYSSNDGGYFDFTGGGYTVSAAGSYDHIRVSDNSTLDTMSSISFEMWINIDLVSGSGIPNILFTKRTSSSDGFTAFFTASAYSFRVGTGTSLVWATSPVTSSWQQIVVTVGNAGSKIYQNGSEVVDAPSYVGNFNNINTNSNLLIGDITPNATGVYAFNGKISIFKIYNTTLSASDVLTNFNAVKSRYGL